MPTKASEMTQEQQRIAELEAQLAQTQTQLKDALRQSEGWLITTENPIYDGVSYGVQFTNGAAFIGVDQYLPFFAVHPEAEESIIKRNAHLMSFALDEEGRRRAAQKIQEIIAKQREREGMSTAERAVKEFGNLPGYTIEYYSPERVMELQSRISDRANQRRKAEAALRAKINAEALHPPGYSG